MSINSSLIAPHTVELKTGLPPNNSDVHAAEADAPRHGKLTLEANSSLPSESTVRTRLRLKRARAEAAKDAIREQQNRKIVGVATQDIEGFLQKTEIVSRTQNAKASLQNSPLKLRPALRHFSAFRSKSLFVEILDSNETIFQEEIKNFIARLASAQENAYSSDENNALKNFLMLNYILEEHKKSISEKITQKIQNELEFIDKKFGAQIHGSINVLPTAKALEKKGVSKKEFLEIYKNTILAIDGFAELFRYVTKRFPFECLTIGIEALKKAVYLDKNSMTRSSISPDMLNAIMNDLRNLNCISFLLEEIRTAKDRLTSMRVKNIPCDEKLLSTIVNLSTGHHMVAELITTAKQVLPSYKEQIVFIQTIALIARKLPDEAWESEFSRAETLAECGNTVQNADFNQKLG
ncbi:MAG: hypothetical protein ACK5NY_11020 [Burkholderiaceae bacterium]|jgi:hypothetical protein